MRGKAHNASLPFPLHFRGEEHQSFGALMKSLVPPTTVKEVTIAGRMRKRVLKGDALTEELISECLYVGAKEYRAKHGARVTWIPIDGEKINLEKAYKEADLPEGAVVYSTFRQRMKSLHQRNGSLTMAHLSDALTLSESDWMTRYGGGRRRPFNYDGDLHPEARGEYSAFSEFLKTIGRYEDRELLHARKKAHWPIDRMLSEPVGTGKEPGYIYRITDLRTGLCYVGLSVNRPEVRFDQHWHKAQDGAETRLHAAMRSAEKGDFKLETLEVVTGNENCLAEREIHWIKVFDCIHPNGLNTMLGGQIGSYDGREVVWEDRKFRSVAAMCRTLSKETGLPEHVIENRFRNELPLPEKARKRSDHPEAGTPLFRQYLSILKRAGKDGVDPAWLDYDRFKCDIATDDAGTRDGDLRLTRLDESKLWGPENFTWMSHADIVNRTHGKVFTAFGRTWPTKELALQEFGIPRNVFDHRIKAGATIEEGLSAPLGKTSKRSFSFEGETWDSRNKACIELAERHGITPHKVKDRLIRGIGTAKWPAMDGKAAATPHTGISRFDAMRAVFENPSISDAS